MQPGVRRGLQGAARRARRGQARGARQEGFSIIYDAVVSLVFWYVKPLEAYRTDRFTGFGMQPAKAGA